MHVFNIEKKRNTINGYKDIKFTVYHRAEQYFMIMEKYNMID